MGRKRKSPQRKTEFDIPASLSSLFCLWRSLTMEGRKRSEELNSKEMGAKEQHCHWKGNNFWGRAGQDRAAQGWGVIICTALYDRGWTIQTASANTRLIKQRQIAAYQTGISTLTQTQHPMVVEAMWWSESWKSTHHIVYKTRQDTPLHLI